MLTVAETQTSKAPVRSILLTILLVSLLALASGCCGPRGCAVTAVCPPAPHGIPHHYVEHCTHPPHQYAEPQWPYYDQSGTPRIMGDARLRSHLGVPAAPGDVAE